MHEKTVKAIAEYKSGFKSIEWDDVVSIASSEIKYWQWEKRDEELVRYATLLDESGLPVVDILRKGTIRVHLDKHTDSYIVMQQIANFFKAVHESSGKVSWNYWKNPVESFKITYNSYANQIVLKLKY